MQDFPIHLSSNNSNSKIVLIILVKTVIVLILIVKTVAVIPVTVMPCLFKVEAKLMTLLQCMGPNLSCALPWACCRRGQKVPMFLNKSRLKKCLPAYILC